MIPTQVTSSESVNATPNVLPPPATKPLPVPVRCFHGESIRSYVRRLEAANGYAAGRLLYTLQSRGILSKSSPYSPAAVPTWRSLGSLDPRCFTTPRLVNGNWVRDRRLCLACCNGESATGALPKAGLVCLRHQRWISWDEDVMPRCTNLALAAERQFRRHLVPTGTTFDAPLMVLALEVAAIAVSPASLEEPALTTHPYLYAGLSHPAIRLYSLQVPIARQIHRASRQVASALAHELAEEIVASIDTSETWRAKRAVLRLTSALERIARDRQAHRQDPWNLNPEVA